MRFQAHLLIVKHEGHHYAVLSLHRFQVRVWHAGTQCAAG